MSQIGQTGHMRHQVITVTGSPGKAAFDPFDSYNILSLLKFLL